MRTATDPVVPRHVATAVQALVEHPFGLGHGPPVQLQGIGLSLLNALCSEFSVTVRKRDATLHRQFRDGQPCLHQRTETASHDTGLHIAGRIQAALCGEPVAVETLRQWLQGVQAGSPSLNLVFNRHALQAPG